MPRYLVLIFLCLAAALTLACGDDGDETPPSPTAEATRPGPGPTAAATGSPQAAGCPVMADVCSFAATVRSTVLAPNSDFAPVLSNAKYQSYTCPATRPQGLGGPYPLCDGAGANETRQGMPVGFLASEGQVLNQQGVRDVIQRFVSQGAASSGSDQYGPGTTRLFSVACPASITACGTQFGLVFSNLLPGGSTQRIEMILFFEKPATGSPQLVYVLVGPLLQPGEEQAALRGGAVQNFIGPQGWPPITTIYPLPQ